MKPSMRFKHREKRYNCPIRKEKYKMYMTMLFDYLRDRQLLNEKNQFERDRIINTHKYLIGTL